MPFVLLIYIALITGTAEVAKGLVPLIQRFASARIGPIGSDTIAFKDPDGIPEYCVHIALDRSSFEHSTGRRSFYRLCQRCLGEPQLLFLGCASVVASRLLDSRKQCCRESN